MPRICVGNYRDACSLLCANTPSTCRRMPAILDEWVYLIHKVTEDETSKLARIDLAVSASRPWKTAYFALFINLIRRGHWPCFETALKTESP